MGKALLFNLCAAALVALNISAQSFQYVRTITVQSSQVSNSDQTNFPVYLNFTDPELKSVANGGHVQSATGADISFFSDVALSQLLPFEVVSYNGTTGSFSAVVLCPRISHTQNTAFYLAYGAAGVSSSAANPAAVWAGYSGVYHLEDNAANTAIYNSASGEGQAANGTSVNSTNGMSTTGQLGSGLSFNGSTDNLDLGGYSAMSGATALTFSGWVKFQALAEYANLFQKLDSNNAGTVVSLSGHYTTSDQDWLTAVRSGGATTDTTNSFGIQTNTWYYFAYVYSGGTVALYINGAPVALTHYGPADLTSVPSVSTDLTSGGRINGILDELRVSLRSYGPDWIATEYNNQSNPGAFATLGGEAPFAPPPAVQSFPISMLGATPTQAVFSYTAPDTNACTVQESTDPTFATVDHDVDPALFAGSASDMRPGNVANGQFRTIVVGFRGTAAASDGKLYSRALQAATTHYLQVSCDSGQYTGTYTFETQNPPLGNNAPDYIPFNTAGFGNYGWPTINYTAPTSNAAANTQIDPLTGFQLQRWTGAGDGGDSLSGWGVWNGVIDLAGSWTNPTNILGSSSYASYSGTGGPSNALYMWGASGVARPSFTDTEYFALDDLQTQVTGYASVSGASYSVCLVYDGGSGSGSSDCLGNILTTTLPQGTASTSYAPSTFPQPILGGWGSPRVTNDMLSNTFAGSLASVSGSTVTWGSQASNGQNVYFPVTVLKPGMRIAIANTAPVCPNNICTVASVQDEQHLTITQSISNWSPQITTTTAAVASGATTIPVVSTAGFVQTPWPHGGSGHEVTIDTGSNAENTWCKAVTGTSLTSCGALTKSHASGVTITQNSYLFPNFGIKLWVNPNGGTVYLRNAQNDWATSNNFFTEFQGAGSTGCNGTPHAVTYAADGVTPLATPTTGYLCTLVDIWFTGGGSNSYLYLMIPSTGESRKLSNYNNGTQLGYSYNTSNGFMQNCSYNDNPSDPTHQKFAVWSDNRNPSLQNPAITCSYVQTSQTVQQEIAAAYPQIDFSYFGAPGLQAMSGTFAKFMMRPQQGALTWFCDLDVSLPAGPGQVQNCHNSWDTWPSRWSGIHGFEYFQFSTGPAYSQGYSDMYSMKQLIEPGTAHIEQWDVTVNKIYNNGGSLALGSTFVDPQTCQQLGVTDARWIALGATGNNCIQVDVSDPLAKTPASQDVVALGSRPVGSRPGPWAHNASSCGGDGSTTNCYSYLQSIQPGDFLVDQATTSHELMLVAAVTPLSGNINVTSHLVLARGLEPFSGDCAVSKTAHSSGFVLTEWMPESCYYTEYNLFPNGNVGAGKMDNDVLKAGHTIEWFAGSDMITSGPYVVDFANDLGGYGAGYGVRLGQPLTVWGSSFMWGVQSLFPFDRSFKGLGIGSIQSHAGGLTYGCPTCEWIVDGRPLGGAGGGADSLWSHTYTKVAGTNSVYQIDLPEGQNTSLDLKRQTVRMWAGQHLIQNISGPNAHLSDATPWNGCIAMNAGECVSGSQAGQIFEVVPQATTSLGCQINMTINTPCVAPMAPQVAGYAQHDISASDPLGLRGRVLTMGLGGPTRTNNYANMHALTNGDWAVTAVFWGDGRRDDVWGVKLPPLPSRDSINRTTFVKLPVSIGGVSGSSVRIRFGYAEYGSDSNGQPLFCSPNRLEDCTTAPANGDPYAFASETQSWTSCSSACVVNIPAVSGRTMYYVIDRKMTNGTVVTGPVQIAPIT
jgi:Concanavalin A-like lectin/glucanases superfamily